MTRYFVNDQEIAAPPRLESFDQILKHIEGVHLAPNSVIRQIHVDGFPITPESLSDGEQILRQMENREKVEIFTGTLAEIAFESITGALEYLVRVEALTPSLSLRFQDMPGPEDFEDLRKLYEGFYYLNLLLEKLAANFQIRLGEAFVQGVSVQEHLQKFISVLKQLIDAQEQRDFMLIADTLEYEIIPVVPVWKEIFGFISQKANIAQ